MTQVGQKVLKEINNLKIQSNVTNKIKQEIDFSEITSKKQSFADSFKKVLYQRIHRMKTTILGDYHYQPKNTFPLNYKNKIFQYLKAKYLTTLVQLEEQKPKKFTNYDPQYGTNQYFKNLSHLKQVWLKLKTNIEAAEDSLRQSQISHKQIKSEYFNEVAFQFDKQRKSSLAWGLILGAIICGTIYRRGSNIRKAALFLTMGHVFGLISYRWNIDKYFDCIYVIFQEDALQFVAKQQKQRVIQESRTIKGKSIMQQ